MTSDRLLVRLVGATVCLLAVLAVVAMVAADLTGQAIADPLDRLAYLLAGGLLGALTTRLTGAEPVPVTTAPGDSVAVEPAAPEARDWKHPDANG